MDDQEAAAAEAILSEMDDGDCRGDGTLVTGEPEMC